MTSSRNFPLALSLAFLLGCVPTLKEVPALDYDGDGYDVYNDCDDTNPDIHADEDCEDNDGDGFVTSEDCDDGHAAVHPGAAEVCDYIDNDCDGSIDEGVTTQYFADADEDGYGDPTTTDEQCAREDGWVANAADCDDTRSDIHPGAEEICDEVDNDCDGDIMSETFYADYDSDGDGNPEEPYTVSECGGEPPVGYTRSNTDCDDANPDTYPGAPEVCDGEVNDCNDVGWAEADEGLDTWWSFVDSDGDGMGNPYIGDNLCYTPDGYVFEPTDCNDGDPSNAGLSDSTGVFADPDGDGQASCYDPSPYEFDPATSVGSWEDWLTYDSNDEDYYVINELDLCGFSGGTPLGSANGPANYGVEDDGTLKEGSNDACSAMMLDVGYMESVNMLISYELRDTTGGLYFVAPLDNGDYIVVFYAYAWSTSGAYLGMWHYDVSLNTASEMNYTRDTGLNVDVGDLTISLEHGYMEATIVGSGIVLDDGGYLSAYYSTDSVGLDIHEVGVGSMDNDTRITYHTFTVTNPDGWKLSDDGVTWVPSGS